MRGTRKETFVFSGAETGPGQASQMHFPSGRNRPGFTLIEVLAVVGILAILAAILFPVMSNARQRGRQASCSSNVRQLALAFTAYTADWDGAYPPHEISEGRQEGQAIHDPWDRRLFGYIGSDALYVCPANDEGTFSYAYNAWIAQPERYVGNYRVKPTEFYAREGSEIPDPSGTILLFEVSNPDPALRGMVGERDLLGVTLKQAVEGAYPGDRDLVEAWRLEALQGKGEEIPDWAWPRHFRGSLFGFADGHVRWHKRLDKGYNLPPS